MFYAIKQFSLKHPVIFLGLAALVVFCCHLTTLMDYPAAWLDEIWILEIGRSSVFEVHPDSSIVLFPSAGNKLNPMGPNLAYLFCFIQESLYRLTGSFVCGRIFALSSLPIATILLFLWLRTKEISTGIALVVSLLFLTDPNATVCAHWYRGDIWTTAFAFLTLYLLAKSRSAPTRERICACTLAGALSASMPFFWISSAILLPLIVWEALLSERDATGSLDCGQTVRDASCFITAGLIATAVIFIPHLPHMDAVFGHFANHTEIGSGFKGFGTFSDRLVDFAKIAGRSPFVWFLAAVGVLSTREHHVHIILFALVGVVILSTRVYHLRMIQFLPFLFLFSALALKRLSTFPPTRGKVKTFIIGSALLSYFSLSVFALNYAAWPTENTYRNFTDKLKAATPKKLDRVYLLDSEYETYYSGRELGWRMYAYQKHDYFFDPKQSANLIDKVDAVIVSSAVTPPPTRDQLQMLADHGFHKTGEFTMPCGQSNAVKAFLAKLFYAHGYPSCEIFTRKRSPPTTRTTRTLRGQTRRTTRPQL